MTQKLKVLGTAGRTLRPPRGRDPSGVLVAIIGSVPLLPLCASAPGAQLDERGRSGLTLGRSLVVGGASPSSGVECLPAFAGAEMQPPPRKVRFAREKGIPGGLGGAEGAYGHSIGGRTQGVARKSKPNTEETGETAQPLSGPAPSPLPMRCFVPHTRRSRVSRRRSSFLF